MAKGPNRGQPLTAAGLRTVFRYHRGVTGIVGGHPHALRHTFGTALAQVRPAIRTAMIAYLDRKRATYRPKTVSTIATRLKHFGELLAGIDPDLDSVAALDRRKHIEPYLSSMVDAVNTKSGGT